MTTTTFFAFAPNGYLYNCPAGEIHSTLPDAVAQRLESVQPKVTEIYHAAFADTGAYFVSYRVSEPGKYDFLGVEHRGLDQSLLDWLGPHPNFKCDLPTAKVVFGPYGQFFAWDKTGHHPGAVLPAVASSLQSDGGPVANPPRLLALGPGGSYLLIKKGGQYYYDLTGCSAETDEYFDRLCEVHTSPSGLKGALDDLLDFCMSNTKPGQWFSIWRNGTVISAVSPDWQTILAPHTSVVREYLQTQSLYPPPTDAMLQKPNSYVGIAEIGSGSASPVSSYSSQSQKPSLHAPQPVHYHTAQGQTVHTASPQQHTTQSYHSQHQQSPVQSQHTPQYAQSPVYQHQHYSQPGLHSQQQFASPVASPLSQHSQHSQHSYTQAPQQQSYSQVQTSAASAAQHPSPQAYHQRPQSISHQQPPAYVHQISAQTASNPATANGPQSPVPSHQTPTTLTSGTSVPTPLQSPAAGTTPNASQRPPLHSTPSVAPSTHSVETNGTATTTISNGSGKTGSKLKKFFKGADKVAASAAKVGKELYTASVQSTVTTGSRPTVQQRPQKTATRPTQQQTQVRPPNLPAVNAAGQPVHYVQRIVQTPQGPQMQYVQVLSNNQHQHRPSIASVSSHSGQIPTIHNPVSGSQPVSQIPNYAGGQVVQQTAGQTMQTAAGNGVQSMQQHVQGPSQQAVQIPNQGTSVTSSTPLPPYHSVAHSQGVHQVQVQQAGAGRRVSIGKVEPTINFSPTFSFSGDGGNKQATQGHQQHHNQHQAYQQQQQHQAMINQQSTVIYQQQPYQQQQQPAVIYEQPTVIYQQPVQQTVIVEQTPPNGQVVIADDTTYMVANPGTETIITQDSSGYVVVGETDVTDVTTSMGNVTMADPQGQFVGSSTDIMTSVTTNDDGTVYDYATMTTDVTTNAYGETDVQYQLTDVVVDSSGDVFVEQDTLDVITDAGGNVTFDQTDTVTFLGAVVGGLFSN